MKLKALAEENQLIPEPLLEDIPDALGIELPNGLDTVLEHQDINRILACAGWERLDGTEHEPIVPKEYEEKHKRSQAAKKAAQTRKLKEKQAKEKLKKADKEKQEIERRKHEEELARREKERLEQEAIEEREQEAREQEERAREEREQAAQARAEAEATAAAAAQVEEEPAAVEEEPAAVETPIEADAAAEPEAALEAKDPSKSPALPASEDSEDDVKDIITRNLKANATAKASAAKAKPKRGKAKAEKAPKAAKASAAESNSLLDEEARDTAKAITQRQERATKIAAAAKALAEQRMNKAQGIDDPKVEEAAPKPINSLGSKLANLAKATAEKSDHSVKDKNIKELPSNKIKNDPDSVLSNEEKRKAIQDNIKRNLDMANRVKGAKDRDKKRRTGFRAIDNRGKAREGQRGTSSPGKGPLPGTAPGMPPGPGGPGARRGGTRGKQHGAKKEETEGRQRGGRRKLTMEEEDLSNITEFTVSLPCSVRDFSEASGIKTNVVIAKLFMTGIAANVNSTIERDAIELLADEFKKTVTFKESKNIEDEVEEVHAVEDNEEDLAPRPPVVTILGHVDHGKTSLLDSIRKSAVTEDEAGGITQAIGAYTVTAPNGMEVTFIDTPGHEAFTEMRARGANATDVAVIVVAADDGVMPQTIEAINHAKAAGVTIVVAMNKIDKEGADKDKVLRELSEQELLPESWGGDIGVIETSAITGQGVDTLLERLALETDVLELRSNHFAQASGIVIEAHMSEGRGVAATLLVQRGSLSAGEIVIAGTGYGRVRNMSDWKGETVKLAGPSHAVEIIGLSDIPMAGDSFHVVDNLKMAADAAAQRQHKQRERELRERASTTTMASIFDDIAASKMKEFKVLVKADSAGSLEVLKKSLKDLSNDEIRINILHAGVGCITTGDVTLAEVSKAIILGFNVIADPKARSASESKGIDIESYSIIYELLDNVKLAMTGMLDPELLEKVIGHAEVRQTFRSSKIGTIAGLYVTDGRIVRDSFMRITREGIIIHEGKVNTLRRFKEDVKEVKTEYECGLTVEKFSDIQKQDIFEFFIRESKARTLA